MQAVDFQPHALVQGAAHGFHHHAFVGAGFLAVVELAHAVLSHAVEGRGRIAAEALHGLAQVGSVGEAGNARRSLAFGGGKGEHLADDDGPAQDGERNEDDHDDLGDEACAGKDGKNVVIHGCSGYPMKLSANMPCRRGRGPLCS